MKPIYMYVSLFCLLTLLLVMSCSCGSTNGQGVTTETSETEVPVLCTPAISFSEDYGQVQKHSLIFIDVTDTTIYGPSAIKYLRQILEKRLSTAEDRRPEFDFKGDKIQIFYISANTATTQKTSLAKIDLRTPPLGELIPGQGIINNNKKRRYLCEIEALIDQKMEEIDQEIRRIRKDNQDVNSDVLGLFNIAHREFSRSDAADKAIFVISDMEQFCHNGGYFSCEQTRICSSGCRHAYAQGDAGSDAIRIQDKLDGLNAFSKVGFHYMRGDRPVGNTNQNVLNFIQDYWAGLVVEVGMNEFDQID
ncbi:MAG: hypothetical protein AAF587_19430 [Bacteroidota bacterium]